MQFYYAILLRLHLFLKKYIKILAFFDKCTYICPNN